MNHPSQPSWWRRAWQAVVPPMPDFNGMLRAQADNLAATTRALGDYLGSSAPDKAARVNALVDEGHKLRDRTLAVLYGSFITPIDREDIYKLAMSLDHVLDYLKNTVREVDVLQVDADDCMQRMAAELSRGTESLAAGVACFADGRAAAVRRAVRTRDAEREVEGLYRKALKTMFEGESYERLIDSSGSPAVAECLEFLVTRIKRREVYRHLSNAADRLAHAGEALRDISIKYDQGRSGSSQ